MNWLLVQADTLRTLVVQLLMLLQRQLRRSASRMHSLESLNGTQQLL